MNKPLRLLLLFLALSVFCWLDSFATDDGEFQYWNTESISFKVNKDLKITLEEEFRFGDDAAELSYQHSDLGITYLGLAQWLDIGLNYRHVFEKKSDKWKEESRPHLNATVKWKLFDIDFSDRSRFEYRDREDAENYWRYRNKFSLKFPFKFTRFQIQPYLADEIFYDFDAETLNRNRFYSGFEFKITKNLKGDIFYLLQRSESNDKWININVLGTKLKLSF